MTKPTDSEPQPGSHVTPEEYQATVYSVSYYRDLVVPEARTPFLQTRLNEEVDELLRPESEENAAEKLAILWGFDIVEEARAHELKGKMASELGDCVFFVCAGAREKDIDLDEVIHSATAKLTRIDKASQLLGFTIIDTLTRHRMEATTDLPPGYRPDYLAMQDFNFSPFIDEEKCIVTADGYYALHRTLTMLSCFLTLDRENFLDQAAETLIVVSAIAQNRLDTTLQRIIDGNSSKLHRRFAGGTLQQGDDTERDRPPLEERPRYTHWDNTVMRLILAELPPSSN